MEEKHMSARAIVRNFIVDNFLFGDDRHLRDDSPFLEEGIIDSTGIMELVAFFEQEFSLSIGDEELIPENLGSIALTTSFLERKGVAT
jgi:acyl carrier protein